MSGKTIPAGSLLALVLAAAWLGGCEDDERRKEQERQLQAAQEQLQQVLQRDALHQQERRELIQQFERQRQELQKQLDEAKQKREQDRGVLEAKAAETAGDTSAATMAWISTSVALVLAILLLCRERHLRNVLQKVLGMLLKPRRRQT